MNDSKHNYKQTKQIVVQLQIFQYFLIIFNFKIIILKLFQKIKV